MADAYPRWWNAHKASTQEALANRNIRTTRDLLVAVRTHHNLPSIDDADPVCARVGYVTAFCKTHLGRMPIFLSHARSEPGVSVVGSKPNSVLVHTPPEEEDARVDPYHEWTVETLSYFPPECYCPLTHDVFEDPVVAADGHTYERAVIEAWFAKSETSPMTNEDLLYTLVVPNRAIRDQITRLCA